MFTLSLLAVSLGIIALLGSTLIWGLKLAGYLTPSDIL